MLSLCDTPLNTQLKRSLIFSAPLHHVEPPAHTAHAGELARAAIDFTVRGVATPLSGTASSSTRNRAWEPVPSTRRELMGLATTGSSRSLRFRAQEPGFPWHAVLPASVKVLPATGTNLQR